MIADADRTTKEMKAKNIFDRYPLLEVADQGCISDTIAICKFLAQGSSFAGDEKDQKVQARIEEDI